MESRYLLHFFAYSLTILALALSQSANAQCTGLGSITFTIGSEPEPTLSYLPNICPGQTTAIVVDEFFSTYQWNTGQNTRVITVSQGGTYIVTVTNSAGCTGTASATISQTSQLNFSVTGLPYQCNGTLTLNAGGALSNYVWSNGSTGGSITVSTSGTYTVTATDAAGCTGSQSIDAVIPPTPQVSITGDLSFCENGNTTLTATPGFTAYQWSGGSANGNTVTVTDAGSYNVIVADTFGCTATQTVTVASQPTPQPQVSQPDPICAGSSTTVQVTLPIFQSYLWSNGGNEPSITVSTAGTYTVTVTDANGCTGTGFASLVVNPGPDVSAAQQPYECNGSAALNATPGFQSYTWSNGGSDSTVSVGSGGAYSVTVTNTDGCTGTAVVDAVIPPAPQVVVTGEPAICEGDNTILSATPGFLAYVWNTGQGDSNISVNSTGTYIVTVTDDFSCTGTALFDVSVQVAPQPQITGTTQICVGGTTVFTATGGNFTAYLWSDGSQTPAIAVSAPGNYSVTVTNAAGCTGAASTNLSVGNSLIINLFELPYQCDGQITLDAGAGFQSYDWSNGGSTQFLAVTTNGNYTVTVTDATGCSGLATAAVNVPTLPQVGISGPAQICTGGTSVLTASSGFLSYLWNNGEQGPSLTASVAGTYTVTATDSNGCTSTDVVTVVENTLPQPQITGSTTLCDGTSTVLSVNIDFPVILWSTAETTNQITVAVDGTIGLQVTDANGCTGITSVQVTFAASTSPQIFALPYACDGQLALDAGTGFQTYTWSNGGATQTTVVSQNGTYEVTVTDASGCTSTANFTATIPTQSTVAIAGSPTFCSGSSTSLMASAGFTTYLWSNGATASEIIVNQAGNYSVTVTDLNGCTGTAQVTVTVGSGTFPQIIGNNVVCVGGTTVLSIANAANFSQISWSNGQATSQITVTAAGNYAVTTTDLSGCTATGSIQLSEGNAPAPVISQESYNCDGNSILQAPSGFQSYTWSTGAGTPGITVSQDGNYSLTVTDASGCAGSTSIFVEIPEELLVVVQALTAPICPGGTSQLSVPPGFASYAWSTGESNNVITVGAPGTYSLTVTDHFGCTASDEYVFNFAAPPVFNIIGNSLDCETVEAVLKLELVYMSGSPSYLWSNGATTATLITAQPGVFSVTVTDGNGCSAVQETNVLQQNSIAFFADTIEFVPGQLVELFPPRPNFLPVETTWSPTGILVGCNNCPTAQARPTENVLIIYEAVSAGGCVQEGTFFLFANLVKPSVYAPNAFSPYSPLNPSFTLFGNDSVVEIKYLRVFSRWGEMVFTGEQMTPGDLSLGWDGTFRGRPVDAGVFVWVAEVLFANGMKEVLKGDVTVVR